MTTKNGAKENLKTEALDPEDEEIKKHLKELEKGSYSKNGG